MLQNEKQVMLQFTFSVAFLVRQGAHMHICWPAFSRLLMFKKTQMTRIYITALWKMRVLCVPRVSTLNQLLLK